MTVVAIPPAARQRPGQAQPGQGASSSASWRRCRGSAVRPFTPPSLSGAGPAEGVEHAEQPFRALRGQLPVAPRTDPSAALAPWRTRLRSRSLGRPGPVGSSQACRCSASVCSGGGSNVPAHRPPARRSTPTTVFGLHRRRQRLDRPHDHPGMLGRDRHRPPARAATSASTGSNGSTGQPPPSAPARLRGPHPRRRIAGVQAQHLPQQRRHRRRAHALSANDRADASAISPCPTGHQPPREPLHLPQRIQQRGIRTHGQIRGQQVVAPTACAPADRRCPSHRSSSCFAHTIDFRGPEPTRSGLSTTRETREIKPSARASRQRRATTSPTPSSLPPFAFQTPKSHTLEPCPRPHPATASS